MPPSDQRHASDHGDSGRLIRLLKERGIEEDEAVAIVTDVCAYTDHTILAKAPGNLAVMVS